jgi:putative chitinase
MTPEQFAVLAPSLSAAKRAAYLPLLLEAAQAQDIDTPLRLAAFVAQLLHESGELRYFEELWGPTEAQKRYEGRLDLGNTEPGDGYRYRGRGPIQITGRANYRRYGLEDQPELAATPRVGFQLAAEFWTDKGLNALADRGTKAAFVTITRRVNGGTNGLADRLARYRLARRVLGAGALPEAP